MRARLAILVIAAAMTALASSGSSVSTAAWTDQVHTAVETSAGKWDSPTAHGAIECYPADPSIKATCEINGISLDWYGYGYRVEWGLKSDAAKPFVWEVRFDIDAKYDGDYKHTGNPGLFPGQPVPAGPWWSEWKVTGFDLTNVCVASTPEELPVVRLRGTPNWDTRVGGGIIHFAEFGFQPTQGAAWPKATCP